MTTIFNGRVTGNNLRREYDFNGQSTKVTEHESSTVEFECKTPWNSAISYTQFELSKYYKIGSKVSVEVTVFEDYG